MTLRFVLCPFDFGVLTIYFCMLRSLFVYNVAQSRDLCMCILGNQYAPCGVQVVQPKQKRIVGGVVANPGSWPWTVNIALNNV